MLNPVLDLTALSGRQASAPVSRDRARSAVLEKFDLASARRQFSLDQASAQRADRAARPADKPAASRKADPERLVTQDRPAQAKEATSPSRVDKPRPAEARSSDAPERPSASRSKDAKPEPATTNEKPAKAEAKDASEPKTATESASAETTKTEATTASPTLQAAPAPPVPVKPPGAPDAATSLAQTAEAETDALKGAVAKQAAGSEGVAGMAANAPSDAAHPDPAKTGETAGPRFSAMLGEASGAAPNAAAAPDPTAALAKPAEGIAQTAKPAEAPATQATAPSQSTTPPVPLGAVPMTIALRSLQDINRFDIRLDPVELGRIDVRLDIDRDSGTVSADLVVDRPATLALLQRDAGALQQALSQAGLDASGGVSLSLRDGAAGQGQGDDQSGRQPGAGQARQQTEPADTIDPGPIRALRLSAVDIRI